jgi:hypothetical protein
MKGTNELSLREYVDTRFEAQREAVAAALAAQEKAVAAALAAADRAVAKAETAAEKRFESVNEFRSALADNFRTLMPRAEAEQAVRTMNDKIDELTKRVNAKEERGRGMGDIIGWIVGGVGLLAAVVGIVLAFTRHA